MISRVARVLCAFALSVSVSVSVSAYDWTYGNLTLWHSEAAYCDPDTYLTRTFKGVLEGFVATYAISDIVHDTHGYIGYHTGQKAIYVSFRGSESVRNWLDNLDVTLTTYSKCSKCEVHQGFYEAEQASIKDIVNQVKSLKSKYPSYTVIVTGHSLGGALATLTAIDLLSNGLSPVRMFNYGSPRVGNEEFAAYASSVLSDHSRVTHHKDMVVHCPVSVRFTHINAEYYQPDDSITLWTCSGYEDPNCSYQWSKTNIDDHLLYLGVVMGLDGCSAVL